jgi:hypothetical protein
MPRIVSQSVNEGLVCAESHRVPLTIGFPIHVLRYCFPDLFDPSVRGDDDRLLGIGSHRKTARAQPR